MPRFDQYGILPPEKISFEPGYMFSKTRRGWEIVCHDSVTGKYLGQTKVDGARVHVLRCADGRKFAALYYQEVE